MRVLILNASPKKKGSASKFFSSVLMCFLPGCERRTCALRGPMDYEKCLEELTWADAVVISAPLYVDSTPGHVMESAFAGLRGILQESRHHLGRWTWARRWSNALLDVHFDTDLSGA